MDIVSTLLVRTVSVVVLLLILFPAQGITADTSESGQKDSGLAFVDEAPKSNLITKSALISPGNQVVGTTSSFSLSGLVGETEISVIADIDARYRQSIAEHRIVDADAVQKVDLVNLAVSIANGRNFSRDSLAAQERIEESKAQTRQALSQLLPSVSLRAARGIEISEPSVIVDPVTGDLVGYSRHMRSDLSLTAVQPLFDLPSYLDWRRRKLREQVREEGYRTSDGDAYLATVESYLSLVSSRLQVSVMRDFEQELVELLNYIEKRAGAGAASVSDMSRVKARRQETLSSRLEQESLHAAAGAEFVRLTNLAPEKVRIPVVEEVGASMLPEAFDVLVADAMASNPEIAAISKELAAARIDSKAAGSNYLPKVEAEYTDNYALHAGGSDDSQRDRRAMLVVKWDLFSGGRDYNLKFEREARQRELRYLLDDQRRRVVQALATNYSALQTVRNRVSAGYEELESISVAAEAMSKRMLSGNQSLLDLLTVYDRRFQVRSRLVKLQILEMNVVAQLVRLTYGTPWDAREENHSVGAK